MKYYVWCYTMEGERPSPVGWGKTIETIVSQASPGEGYELYEMRKVDFEELKEKIK